MAPLDVPIALLGYGTVGAAVHRLLVETGEDIERATGRRLRVKRALVRDLGKTRSYEPEPGVLTTDIEDILRDEEIVLAAEVMGGLEPAGAYVLDLLRRGVSVVTANKQLVAHRSPELFAAASESGAQLRFEACVCAAIPVIKVLREALVATHVHRVLGIVNGTTNFVLGEMEAGRSYEEALVEAQRLGYAEADPVDDVSGADAAAKMAILASVAFGARVAPEDVEVEGIEAVRPEHVAAARALDMTVKLVGQATLVDGAADVRVGPALVDRHHPLASVEGAFNAVMLQGDAIREITLSGPGAGGIETASAVVADLVSIVGTAGPGFLQDDPARRTLARADPADVRSPFYVRIDVDDRPGVLARVAGQLAVEGISVARLVQSLSAAGATLHIVTHEAPVASVARSVAAIAAMPEALAPPTALRVVSDRGVEELGWT
ncbi:MAG: homoserine dehydrogenase [Thermoleophilia bacterium]|nr:homoserine dehydrogenase [Gaiellaceae bacterium]MDW8337905.1 homoserine dehydrogenase [Thermoleophilia bacterium]